MARAGGGLNTGDLMYYGAIGGLTYFGYKLSLEGAFGKAAQLSALDVQGALTGASAVAIAAAKAGVEQAWASGQPGPISIQKPTTSPAPLPVTPSRYTFPLDLGPYGGAGFAWDGARVVTINEGAFAGNATTLAQALQRVHEWFG